ncbi:DNA-3-methyladenine glycosylase [Rhodocaloribacter litoris]|uniref:DNA-3-methyladenine glycosylase family protein n=1 Tax=Rhodocaloribacter litoris TaxID=2558931 RepID=UPI001E2A9B43|nr:DNA-3-methyladenine glycosylase [Rhodocaloribacter litoris]QXD16110.1 DNA-3-methyladenine glycosylase [Rhodocaloribacter litoris]
MSLPYDPHEAARMLAGADPELALLIERVGPPSLERPALQSPFEALARAIVYQQLSTQAARTIYGRVQALFPGGTLTPAAVLACDDAHLRAAGMSRAKVAAVKDLAARTLEGVVPDLHTLQDMDDEAIIARLTRVRGVGRWTVEMFLLFRLGRPDVLPATDLGIRRGFMRTYRLDNLPEPRHILDHGTRWQPYRSVASWYLWRAVDGPAPV